jgi:hypothetical protein
MLQGNLQGCSQPAERGGASQLQAPEFMRGVVDSLIFPISCAFYFKLEFIF